MSKNVFSDLGFSRAEAAAIQARVSLAVEIERYIERHGLTQAKAAAAPACAPRGWARLAAGRIVIGDSDIR
ncbi:MAG TPA: XRE family transcriptional regulator [Steroidobacteraceae bacterium]